MLYILIAFLMGIILAINFKILEGVFIIGCICLIFIVISNKKLKIRSSPKRRFISSQNTGNDEVYIESKKLFIALGILVLSFTYSLIKIKLYDNKYESSEMSGEFIIISKDESSEFYNKYNCKNIYRR